MDMKKIIYIILGLVVIGGLIFSSLYFNGNYNDKSKVSENFNTEEFVMEKKMGGEAVVEKEETISEKGEVIVKKNSEFMIKKDTEAKVVAENKILKTGSFNKIDPAHYAFGEVVVISDANFYYLNFQNNFSSANGPDLYVYLSLKQEYKNIAIGGVDTSKTLNIGKLKNISGAQSYKVSKAEFEKYSDSVIIWCKDFGIQFSRADLR